MDPDTNNGWVAKRLANDPLTALFTGPLTARGVRSRFFYTTAPVLTNQTPDPAPGQ